MFEPYWGHFFGFFYNILASRCLKWLTFSLDNPGSQLEEYHSMSNYWDHKRAMFRLAGPCFGYFYNIFASGCLKWLTFSLESHASQIEEYHSMSNYWDNIRAMIGPY